MSKKNYNIGQFFMSLLQKQSKDEKLTDFEQQMLDQLMEENKRREKIRKRWEKQHKQIGHVVAKAKAGSKYKEQQIPVFVKTYDDSDQKYSRQKLRQVRKKQTQEAIKGINLPFNKDRLVDLWEHKPSKEQPKPTRQQLRYMQRIAKKQGVM